MTERFSKSARASEDDGESSGEDNTDNELADEESLQLSVPTSQESEPSTQNHPMGAELLKVKAEVGAQEEAGIVCIVDMDVTRSKATSATEELPPASSQDNVIIHTTEDKLRSLE